MSNTIPLPTPYYPQWSHSNEQHAWIASQMHAHAAAVSAAKDARIKVLEDALQRYVNYDLLTGTRGKMNEIARAALGELK